VFGYVPPALRPDAIEVETDAHGRAFLPRVGYFSTEERCASLVLEWDRSTGGFTLSRDDRRVPFRLEAPAVVPGTTIEVARYNEPLLATRFFDRSLRRVGDEVRIEGKVERHLPALVRALTLLSQFCPEYYEDVVTTTRRFVLFEHPAVNSFASLAAHGTAFFSVRAADEEPYFLDEVAHQCGHVIFYATTLRRKDFLAVDPTERLAPTLGGDHEADEPGQETRTVYGAFHGLHTEYTMIHCLSAVERAGVFSGRRAHELFGRLAFIARKAKVDLATFGRSHFLTPLGAYVYRYFKGSFDELHRRRPDLFAADMRGQPYTFDYDVFAQANPDPRGSRWARPAM
jgi:hypothetical protein